MELKLPKTPQNLKATNVTDKSVTLSWEYDGEESLTLYTNDEGKPSENSPKTVGDLMPNTEYTFKIETDTSKLSDSIKVKTLPKE